MAKRRILKKEISAAAGTLFTEVLVCKLYIPGVDPEKADQLMTRTLDMADDFITRVSHPDGKDNAGLVKSFYRKLRADLQAEVNAIAHEIEELSKAGQA